MNGAVAPMVAEHPQLTLERQRDALPLAIDRRLERALRRATVALEADEEELGGERRAALAGGARFGDGAAIEATLDRLAQRARAIEEAPQRGQPLDADREDEDRAREDEAERDAAGFHRLREPVEVHSIGIGDQM